MMHIYFVSLGCDKNLVDSEKMLALLTKEGYELTDEPEQAEIIVVNTCAFIHDAKQESIETLLELAEYKKTGKCKVLIASGCLAERYQNTIFEEMPEIDGVIGTTAYDDIAVVVKKALGGEHAALTKELDYLPVHLTDRVTSGMSHVGYLKISEGCNKNCTYCIIPSTLGRSADGGREHTPCTCSQTASGVLVRAGRVYTGGNRSVTGCGCEGTGNQQDYRRHLAVSGR